MRRFLALSGLILSLAFIGCGPSGHLSGLHPCEGTVTYNGSPVAEAVLTFHPDASGGARSASAITDTSGKFKVTTLKPEDGIGPGNYKVTIIKFEEYGDLPPKVMDDYGDMVQPVRPQKNVLPKKYENPATSGLTVTIDKGKKTENFELVD